NAKTSEYDFGAAYVHLRLANAAAPLSFNGVRFSLARNLNSRLVIEGEGAGYHVEGFRLGTLMAGLRFNAISSRRIVMYGEGVAGWAHSDAAARGFPSYRNSLAWAIGGGIESRISRRLSLQIVQADYLQTRLGAGVQHSLRLGSGFVLHFGALR